MGEWILRTRKRITALSLVWLTAIIRLFARVVPYRIGVSAGGTIGFLCYYLLRRERNRTLSHLEQVFGDKGVPWIRRTARRCFVHLGKALLEVMLMSPRHLSRLIDLEGEENLRKALEQKRGVVYVTGHIGNWELMAQKVACQYPLSVIAAPIEPEPVNDMIVELRAGMGVRTILRGRPGSTRELIRAFRENRILGILIDQDTDVESAFVDFMGRPAWTPTAAASMAIKFGAPMVFGYIQREKGCRHKIFIEGPLPMIMTNDTEKDIVANTAMLTKKIEDVIQKNPEQWVWMHRRWRRRP
jgi:KDO2-lipid IV(A) lauroyltransferase